jgi:hypothetical protein
MGYWKREYTEGKGGRPLFRPEPAPPPASQALEPDHAAPPAEPHATPRGPVRRPRSDRRGTPLG